MDKAKSSLKILLIYEIIEKMKNNHLIGSILGNRLKELTCNSTITTLFFASQQCDSEEESECLIRVPINPKAKFIQYIDRKSNVQRRIDKKKMKLQFNDSAKRYFYQVEENSLVKNIGQNLIEYKEIEENGNIIQGFWLNDKLEGEGRVLYANGDQFKGKFKNGIQIEGKYSFSNGDSYHGQFLGKYMHGKGILKIKEEKMRISGNWEKNKVEGTVKINYGNGDIYYGNFQNMKKEGKGQYFFNDGRKYIGEFEDGSIQGRGILFDAMGIVIAKGQWNDGELTHSHLTSIAQL